MPDMLAGKIALITGAGRGIGREIALMMAAQGARVVVNDLGGSEGGEGADAAPAQEVVDAIVTAGGQAVANTDSVADAGAAQAMVAQAIDTFGTLDCVVNNAGILRDAIFHKMSEHAWDSVINVHLKGSFNVSSAAARHFREQESGAIVHMTSTSGLIGNIGQANYAAAKLGIVGLSKSIALDMQRFNVRSNCIAPTAWTRMIGTIPTDTDKQKDRVEKLKQMTPDKIAPLAVYLCSDAARGVSGQIFCVRNNELFLMGQSRPLRGIHENERWTPESIATHAMPAFAPDFYDLDVTTDVFGWDPV